MNNAHMEVLLKKYDVPVPRYTSYPPVPNWRNNNFSHQQWTGAVKQAFDESNSSKGISLYLHLPFCESLCTYCACNTRITRNHQVEERYIKSLLNEWSRYQHLFGEAPVIRELHIGGGTPTFFSPDNLVLLLSQLLENSVIHPEYEFSFEGHPNNTTEAHLHALHALGFRRVSFGVQDLDPVVQKTINRIQPFENVQTVTSMSRQIGYHSISFDLIYGLPYQTVATVTNTIEKVLSLKPDRIAFYSYAHVPWIKPGQRGYEDTDLPTDVIKRSLYETGRQLLLKKGYIEIGMDHFAQPCDSLAVAHENKSLHRNFMGYTTSTTDLLVGLGASAISDAKYAYAQNAKSVEDYHSLLSQQLPVFKGHLLTPEDLITRQCILSVACTGQLEKQKLDIILNDTIMAKLREMEQEGMIILSEPGLEVTSLGRPFIRNICNVFDASACVQGVHNTFSKAI